MKKIYPRSKQILVKPDSEESRESESGILTPDNVEQEKKSIGTVISVGKEIEDIKKDDRVIYGAYSGERLKFKEGMKEYEFVLLHTDDVLATIED
jgi:co-chaperonin GroES (HSP10)